MDKSNSTMAKQVALAAIDFEQQRTGHVPKSVTAVMSDDTLVITLHAALSPAEKALAKSPEGAAQVQEFHQQLFNVQVFLLADSVPAESWSGNGNGQPASPTGVAEAPVA